MSKLTLPGLVFYTILSGSGLFLGPGLSNPVLVAWIAGYLLLLFTVFYRSLFILKKPLVFEYIVLGIIGLNAAVQMTGGLDSPFHAVYFLLAAAALFQPPLRAYTIAGVVLLIEGGNLLFSGAERPFWQQYAGFAASLAGIVVIVTPVLSRAQRGARFWQERYEKLVADADAIDPLAGGAPIEALSQLHRQAANINTTLKREGAFSGLISMIYEIIPAHSYALFLADREEGVFVLRAIRSETSDTARIGDTRITTGSGLLGICLDKEEPHYLADTVVPSRNLSYYTGDIPIKSLFVIPIPHQERTVGVLVVDSLEHDAFSPDDRDLLVRFAPFFSQMIEKIGISQELDVRAKNFAALHQMSATLNSSLDINEVLEKLSAQIKSVVPFDYCAFLLYDERSADAVITTLSGYDAKLTGKRFPLQQSVIMAHMMKQWTDEMTARAYYDGSLGTRGREISLFPFKELQCPIQSLYGRPLTAHGRFIGALFLASSRMNAFSEYHRNFMDTLLNQVSMVVDNSILHRNLRDMARTDGLTGLLNHRTFMDKLGEEFKRLDRDEQQHFSLLLLDIDYFKKVNDEYGHPVGDVALKCVANIIRDMARSIDFVARYGGEEFAVGMVGADLNGARKMAERIRKSIEQADIIAGRITLRRTVSIGVASCGRSEKPETLIAQADEALYRAKKTGRNRVFLYKDISESDVAGIHPR